MKRLTILAICIFSIGNVLAQIPKNFKYQAVVRDVNGEIYANKLIALRLSILQDQDNGASVYSEIFESHSTNEYGIASVNVGSGTVVLGNFNNISWGQHSYYLKVELDIQNQSNYVVMGTSQILAVPYALYAQDVLNNNDADADPTNEIQDLQLVNNILTITRNANSTPINLSQYIGVDTDDQTLSVQTLGNTVQISILDGNTINFNLPSDFVSRSSGGTYLGPINATNILGNGIISMQGNFTLSGTSPVQFTSSGITSLNLPVSGTLATQDWVTQNINSSNTLATGNIWVGIGNVATPMPANGIGQILVGNGTGLVSVPISGDASISGTGALTLSSTGVSSGSYFRTQVDSKGRVTGGSNPTTLAGFGITDAISSNLSSGNIFIGNSSNTASQVTMSGDASLSNSGQLSLTSIVTPGRYTRLNVDSKGRVTFGDNPTTLSEMGILDGITRSLNNRNILIGDANNLASQVLITGDASLANDGTLTLASTGITPGTYRSINVDIKGRVISGTNPTTLSGYGITDAMNISHPAYGITSTNITNWNTAFGWGNHFGLYRPISYVPAWSEITGKPTTLAGYGIIDAMSTSHVANGITGTNITNWNTAYGWGNHSGLYRPISYVPAWSEITSNPFLFTAPVNNQLIRYNSTSSRWENWTPNYLTSYTETDPIFLISAANGITNTNITNWNTAFSWGNHSGLYRPISYVPAWSEVTSKPTTLVGYGITDAMSTSHVANGITGTNITNWNTAFSWGNHSGLYRPISYVPDWSEITGKPTTLAGYGITDALSTSYTGSTNLTTLGTISIGTWQGSMIGNSYINWASPGDIGLTIPKSASFTTVNISNIINLVPQGRPLSPNNGDIYIDSGDDHIYCYVNGSWKQLDN